MACVGHIAHGALSENCQFRQSEGERTPLPESLPCYVINISWQRDDEEHVRVRVMMPHHALNCGLALFSIVVGYDTYN